MSLKKQAIYALVILAVLAVGCSSPAAPSPTTASAPPAPTTAAAPQAATPSNAKQASALSGEVKIGRLISESGLYVNATLTHRNATKLAVDLINKAKYLGDATLVMDTVDDQSDTNAAVTGMRKLANDSKVMAMFGPTSSTQGFAAGPVAMDAKLTEVCPCTAAGLTDIGQYMFVPLPTDVALIIPSTVQTLMKLYPGQIKTVANVYSSDYDTGVVNAKKYKEEFEKAGAKVFDFTHLNADTDFSALLTKAEAQKPDLYVLWGTNPGDAMITAQIRRMGSKAIITGGAALTVPAFLQNAGDAAETVVFPVVWAPNLPTETAKSKEFVQAYQQAYNSLPDQWGAAAFDSVWLMADAIKRAGKADRVAVHEAFMASKGFPGVLGSSLAFDQERHLITDNPVLMTWKAGKQVPFQK